jgi:hypothetical protein
MASYTIKDASGVTQTVTIADLGTAGSPATTVLSVQGVSAGTALPVSAASLPLPSGAALAAKQPDVISPGSTSTTCIAVQGSSSGIALPISASALPLPTGAATSANQPAPTAAGTPASSLIGVQGNASGVPLPVLAGIQSSVSSQVVSIVTAGTAQAAASATAFNGFNLYGDDSNTDLVYYGGSGVTSSNGTPIAAGKQTFITAKNANEIFFLSATTAQKIRLVGS